MKIVAITSTWNNALWIESSYNWIYPLVDTWIIQEANWTSDDGRWAGNTSPDGTAEIIRKLPDPAGKIRFYQLGKWNKGCLAARAELCTHIPECDWVYVADMDEFNRQSYISWIQKNLPELDRQGYTSITQKVRSFYWDFTQHTVEEFTRWQKWYPGFNAWVGYPLRKRDYKVGTGEVSSNTPRGEIFHYSYVPVPGVEIKGAMSFDVPRERYQEWYKNTYSSFNGENLQEIYDKNEGGVHVFRGNPVHRYTGPHPEVLDNHPLRYALWTKDGYVDSRTHEPIELKGWWSK